MTWVVVLYGIDSDAEAGRMDIVERAYGPFATREDAEAHGRGQWHSEAGGREWDLVELEPPPHAIDCDMDDDCVCRSEP